jgi:hypothetical protein
VDTLPSAAGRRRERSVLRFAANAALEDSALSVGAMSDDIDIMKFLLFP